MRRSATGLRVGGRFVATPRVCVSTWATGRDYRLGMLDRARIHLELGVEAQRRESALRAGADGGARLQATLRW